MKYNLRGYHINLPDGYERGLWKLRSDTTDTRVPKYMLVSNTGEIITKYASSPSNTEELTKKIDSLLMNKKRYTIYMKCSVRPSKYHRLN